MFGFAPCSRATPRLSAVCPSSYRAFSVSVVAHSKSTTPQAYVERLSDVDTSTKAEGIAVLTLNRPEAKNAIGQQLLAELEESIEQVQYDRGTRVLILRSLVPNTFCAGADLKERKTMSESQVDRFLASLRRTFSAFERLSVPTIAALDGLAMGGGMELALCADLRVASTSTDKLGLPETRLGIIPGAGGTYRMSKLIGPSRTKELVFTARLLNGQQAFDMGIVDRLATSTGQSQSGNGAAFDMSVQLASAMAQNGPVALRAAKAAIDKAQILDTESALDWERACYERCLRTKDRLEGLKAFAEKRKPQYTGE